MALDPPRPMRRILRSVRQALGMSQTELADAIGSSRRTIIRRERGYSAPVPSEVQELADLVRSEDPDLADELLIAGGIELKADIETQSAAPIVETHSVVAPARLPKHAVDAVLYAAADAMDESPRRIKPAIVAAFLRAKEMELTVEEVIEALDSMK
jgi:transcriptional regulator with XRE-family HTH domain